LPETSGAADRMETSARVTSSRVTSTQQPGAAAQPASPAKQRHKGGPRQRRIPQRTCVACRQVAGKRQLVRIVRTPAGAVEIDLTGKKNGRGAYLHADPACWDIAFRRKALQHALKTELGAADRAALDVYRAALAPAADASTGASVARGAVTSKTANEKEGDGV
jgi:predicted RNA-binding protein YlxR (DUF448 family)